MQLGGIYKHKNCLDMHILVVDGAAKQEGLSLKVFYVDASGRLYFPLSETINIPYELLSNWGFVR